MITALTAASTSASAQTITGSEPPSSSVTPLELRRGQTGDVAADRGRAGERDPPHVGMRDERVADLRRRGR